MITQMPSGEFLMDESNINKITDVAYKLGQMDAQRNANSSNFWLGLLCGVGLTIGGIIGWYCFKEDRKDADLLEDL